MAVISVADGATEATTRTAIETTAADGDTVEFAGAISYTLAGGPFLVADKAIRIVAKGPRAVKITAKAGAAQEIFRVTNSGAPGASTLGRLEFIGMSMIGDAASTDAVSITGTAGKGKYSQVKFRDCTMSGFRDAINVSMPNIGADAMVHLGIDDCEITSNRRYGLNLSNVTMARIAGGEINGCADVGVRAITCPNIWLGAGLAVEGNNTGNNPVSSTGEGGQQVLLKLCHGFVVDGIDIEALPTAAAAGKQGILISNCNGGTVVMASVSSGDQTQFLVGTNAIRAVLSSRGIRVLGLLHAYMQNPVSWDASCEPIVYDEACIVQTAPSDLATRGMFST